MLQMLQSYKHLFKKKKIVKRKKLGVSSLLGRTNSPGDTETLSVNQGGAAWAEEAPELGRHWSLPLGGLHSPRDARGPGPIRLRGTVPCLDLQLPPTRLPFAFPAPAPPTFPSPSWLLTGSPWPRRPSFPSPSSFLSGDLPWLSDRHGSPTLCLPSILASCPSSIVIR